MKFNCRHLDARVGQGDGVCYAINGVGIATGQPYTGDEPVRIERAHTNDQVVVIAAPIGGYDVGADASEEVSPIETE
ncbi:MAG: hypothetical protein GY878_03635 [Fuerstiella sp.]|nr:hypothetical protein [Fuerstiella sp.]